MYPESVISVTRACASVVYLTVLFAAGCAPSSSAAHGSKRKPCNGLIPRILFPCVFHGVMVDVVALSLILSVSGDEGTGH